MSCCSVVAGADGGEDLFVGLLVDLLALALAGAFFDHRERAGGLCGAHDRALGAGPGEGDERLEGPPAHRVVAGAVAAAHDDDDLGHDRVAHRVDHLGAGADDAGLLAVAPDHEAGRVVQEDQRDLALVAVHDEPGGFVRGRRRRSRGAWRRWWWGPTCRRVASGAG
jgi:hypothetical protein